MKKEFLEAGKIVTTHGIRGEVKIMPYTDSPELLAEFDRLFIGKKSKSKQYDAIFYALIDALLKEISYICGR